jgi:uncharacterized Ntn-hydrolase superfamily protein
LTYSVVARDPETGELGGAVQSRSFGAVRCVWARSGVGVVTTQSFADLGYGPLGLELMGAGKSAAAALAGLTAADEERQFRQVAMVDASGGVAVHTGAACIAAAGHETGEGFSVQANMMASERVWPAMADAFREAPGTLPQRLLAALDAAQDEGGDWRGQQAAALLVVAAEASGHPWDDVLVDVRVHDSDEPLVELRRLVGIAEFHRRLRPGSGLSIAEATELAREAGLAEQDVLWAGVLAGAETDVEEGRRHLERLLALEPRFVEVVRRRRPLAEAYGFEPVEGAP